MRIKDMIAYRSIWMGIAMLWIMIYHTNIVFPSVFKFFKMVGYGGVDIFIFASGIGNYYSYLKDKSPLDFLKRRIIRLAPAYLPVIIVWCIYYILKGKLNLLYVLGNIFAVQGFSSSGANFSWFISCIIVCYIMTPYFASFIEKNTIIHNFILVIFLIVASTAFIYDHKFIIVATRIPIYVIGMIFAKNDHHEIKGLIVPLLIAFMVGIIVLGTSFKFLSSNIYDYGLYWYPFILITPFLCLMFTKVSILFERAKLLPILNAIKLIGNISFELFLIHIFIFGLYAPETDSFETRYSWLVLSLISILISILYSYMLKRIKKYSMRLKLL